MDDHAYWRGPDGDRHRPAPTGDAASDPAAARGAPAPGYRGPPPTARPADPAVPVLRLPSTAPLPPQDHRALDAAEARARRVTAVVGALGLVVVLLLVVSAWLG